MKKVISIALLFLMSFFIITTALSFEYASNKKKKERDNESKTKNYPHKHGEFRSDLLSHKLIMTDVNMNLTSKDLASLAFGSTTSFYNNAIKTCSPHLSTIQFLKCSNSVLGKHFYYKISNIASIAYANHYSDCDLNVYLLFDVANAVSKDIKIIYAPSHAFIAYRDDNSEPYQYWETTTKDNHGAPADLLTPFYIKSINKFHYTPFSDKFAEELYSVLILGEVEHEKKQRLLNELSGKFSGNTHYQRFYFENKQQQGTVTLNDIKTVEMLLQTDPESIDKKLFLSNQMINKGNNESAKKILNTISLDRCQIDCMEKKKNVSTYSHLPYSIAYLFDLGKIRIDEHTIKNILIRSLALTVILFIALIVTVQINSKYMRKKKQKTQQSI